MIEYDDICDVFRNAARIIGRDAAFDWVGQVYGIDQIEIERALSE